jgi:hypothetical protein
MPRRDEHTRGARLAALCALMVIASFVASKAARDAILLSRFSVKSLPIFIGISAVGSLPIILIAGRLMTRLGPRRLMPYVNLASAALAVVEWWLLPTYPRPIAALVYLHLATSSAVLVSGFWSIVNERFDIQNAKRHIGRIGIGATVGGILGGVLAERTAVFLPAGSILLVLAGLQLGCAVLLRMFGGADQVREVATTPQGTWQAFRAVTRSALLRNVGAIVVLGAVAAGVLDYVFKADIVAATSQEGLLRSLAIFYTVTSVLTAVLQVAVCGPLIARLGVPRSVATLPAALAAFGAFALIVPGALSAAIARGAELVTRNSIFRAGYELLYAPLAEDDKRPAKVVLDVGADRVGDLIGAQLVTAVVYLMAEPRIGLLVAAVITGALGLVVAIRLPRHYTTALEQSLLARAPAPAEAATGDEPEPWITLSGLPRLGHDGDVVPLIRRPRRKDRTVSASALASAAASAGAVSHHPHPGSGHADGARHAGPHRGHPEPRATRHDRAAHDDVVHHAISDLRSGDPARIERVLTAGLTPELAAYAIELVGRDDVAMATLAALRAIAPRCTGMIVDALVDPERPIEVRRRLPAVLLAGEPALAAWGLWRALGDASFEVRYRSGAALSRLAESGHVSHISAEEVFEAVRRELVSDRTHLAAPRVVDPVVGDDRPSEDLSARCVGAGLEHVFTVLGLALPAEPLRIALHAVQHDDPELRGTALEYLESILPTDVRAQLWPLLEGIADEPAAAEAPATAHPRPTRSNDEILASLRLSYERKTAEHRAVGRHSA